MADFAQDLGDGALVLAVQGGDADAFAELFRRHYPAVRRACGRRLSDPHGADEVAQAAFVRAFERIDQCAGERRFGPWVHVIARSMTVDAFRAQARVEPREQPLAGGRDHRPNEPEESLLSSERAAQMAKALATLPDRQRRAVIARDWEELRPGEIADRLGLSVGAVDSLLLRARRRLALAYAHLAGEGGRVAGVLPLRSAFAALAVAVLLCSQAVMAGATKAADALQGTAGEVVSAVVSVAQTLTGGFGFEAAPEQTEVSDEVPEIGGAAPPVPQPAPAFVPSPATAGSPAAITPTGTTAPPATTPAAPASAPVALAPTPAAAEPPPSPAADTAPVPQLSQPAPVAAGPAVSSPPPVSPGPLLHDVVDSVVPVSPPPTSLAAPPPSPARTQPPAPGGPPTGNLLPDAIGLGNGGQLPVKAAVDMPPGLGGVGKGQPG